MPPVPGRFEVVRFCRTSVCRQCVFFRQHQNCESTSDGVTLVCYFSLSIFGSTGTKFGFTNFRSYFSKDEFYDVFK